MCESIPLTGVLTIEIPAAFLSVRWRTSTLHADTLLPKLLMILTHVAFYTHTGTAKSLSTSFLTKQRASFPNCAHLTRPKCQQTEVGPFQAWMRQPKLKLRCRQPHHLQPKTNSSVGHGSQHQCRVGVGMAVMGARNVPGTATRALHPCLSLLFLLLPWRMMLLQ